MIGADILDKTGQNAFSFGRLREEPTWWELDSNQRIHFDEVRFELGKPPKKNRKKSSQQL